jgi:hypothetical protein
MHNNFAITRSTLIDLPRLYTDANFRERVVSRLSDPIPRRFWLEEFAEYDKRFLAEAIAPVLNKAGQFATSPNVRSILGQVAPKFDLAHAMNNRGILIVNLSKGQIGEPKHSLLYFPKRENSDVSCAARHNFLRR